MIKLNIWLFLTIGTTVASTIALIVICLDLDNPNWDVLWMPLVAYVLNLIHCYVSIATDDNFKYLERKVNKIKDQNPNYKRIPWK